MSSVASPLGSFLKEDVILLLKDLTGLVEEKDTLLREKEIQSGRHYSENLPIERLPSREYGAIFDRLLREKSLMVAVYTGILTRLALRQYENPVFISLVRAGVPCGVLMRRYAKYAMQKELPHYGVSIIRGKGLDENAMLYILKHHTGQPLVFVDGWTGKGMITTELARSCEKFSEKYQCSLAPVLAVLADPAHSCSLYATREDFINPSCCLNSTICGLISRSVHNEGLIGPDDFHGVRVYNEFRAFDRTYDYLDSVTALFSQAEAQIRESLQKWHEEENQKPDWKGMEAVKRIGIEFGIDNLNRIKPSIGETTRVLLRRIPDQILLSDPTHPDVAHILYLAKEKSVKVRHYPDMPYLCCGLIADKRGERL